MFKGITFKIKKVWQLFEGYKLQFGIIMLLIILTSLAEMISVGTVFPILQSVLKEAESTKLSKFYSIFLDKLPQDNLVLYIILILVFFSVCTFILRVSVVYFSTKTIQKIQLNWQSTLFEKYLYSIYEYVLRFKQGEIIYYINDETRKAGNLLNMLIKFISNSFIGFSIYLLLLTVNFYETLFLSVIIIGIMSLVRYLGEKYQLKLSRKMIQSTSQMNSTTAESIMALQQVKLFSLESIFHDNFREYGKERNRAFVLRNTINEIPANLTFFIMPLVFLFFYLYFTFISSMDFKTFLPSMGLIFVGFTRISASLMQVLQNRMQIYNILPSLQLFERIMSEPVRRENLRGGEEFESLETDIEISHVDFSYDSASPIFTDLYLTIPKGKTTAIIGPSGSGKSTISYLLTGLYKPQRGAIYINGRDLEEYSVESLRRRIGFVTQDTFVFNMSIRENIRIGKTDAADEEVEKAAQAAHCVEFIEKLPEGWDTVVGERGMKLSGGQRQRIAIARALIRNPELYIFDEATSSLDNHSEKLIQQSIDEIRGGATVIIIAHRLSTIENADVVYDLGEMERKGSVK